MSAGPSSSVLVQEADFDVGRLQEQLLAGAAQEGAVATFTGYVRRGNDGRTVEAMELEHYPGMTEASIGEVVDEAIRRWSLLAASVVHRVGKLGPGERIVWVGVASAHRGDAHSACEFIMDYLKTRAPLWKKEHGPGGERWVEARESDSTRAGRWDN
ncbi:MAG: molybdopterin synthase catalytic subunit MoaE [Halioglobus sp.]|nr:molybdopterin synthase catalytic subunit MoaE [Halioglobus sp.]